MKNYTYELFDRKHDFKTGINSVKCRIFNLNETMIEVFSLLITKENKYQAWTCDTIGQSTIERRKEIEQELNQ